MKFLRLTLSLIVLSFSALAQEKDETAMKYAETITQEDLTEHLTTLASDKMEGRETGEKGQKMAAEYIKNHFASLGLRGPVSDTKEDNYFQKFNLYISRRTAASITQKKKEFKNLKDIVFWSNASFDEQKIEAVYVNKATEEDLESFEVKDKFVVFEADGQFTPILKGLEEKGAKGAFVIVEDSSKMNLVIRYGKYYSTQGSLTTEKPKENGMLSMVLSASATETLFKKPVEELEMGDEASFKASATVEIETIQTENVLGYLEGGELKDELLVLTAHYDHVGMNETEIYNGADDDGSGTSAVLELAEAFVKAKKEGHGPKRSILFMTVTGEEKGLLGSAHYVKYPIFPLKNTVVNLNIDMIGRTDSIHAENREFVYLIGSDRLSSDLHELSENMNSTYTKLDLDYTYNAEDHPDRIYYRSDHWNFAKNGIPIIFYFNGTHEDYHKPTDTVDKIEFDLLKKRTHLVFYTAWEIANRDQRLVVDKKVE